jgi:hypothetical protein
MKGIKVSKGPSRSGDYQDDHCQISEIGHRYRVQLRHKIRMCLHSRAEECFIEDATGRIRKFAIILQDSLRFEQFFSSTTILKL